ncbi:MAG: UbiA prenyltransferase family protein [Microcoleaceae cyanobacterium]
MKKKAKAIKPDAEVTASCPLEDRCKSNYFLALIKLIRPHQWIKNGFCFAGIVFGGRLLETEAILLSFIVFFIFSLAASAVYIFNDIQDIKRDRCHPKKKFRPLASGSINIKTASLITLFLSTIAILIAAKINSATLACLLLYLFNNIAYSLKLKNLPLFDVSCVALGFVLRLLAGIYALEDMPTAWITLCTFFLTLFLGLAKRRAELLTLLIQQNSSEYTLEKNTDTSYLKLFYQRGKVNIQRPVLSHYTLPFLDSLLNNTATMTIMCYSLFTITSDKNSSLVITVPLVYYAVMHYKRIVTVLETGEEPTQILLRDRTIQMSLIIWLILYLAILYFDLTLFI